MTTYSLGCLLTTFYAMEYFHQFHVNKNYNNQKVMIVAQEKPAKLSIAGLF